MNLKFLTLLIIKMILLTQLNASNYSAVQDSTKSLPLSISGSVDVYYRTNLSGEFFEAPGTSFANLPGFSLGMGNVIISHEGSKVGVTGDLVFGPRGEDATFLSPFLRPGGNSSIINQLYAYWNISDKVTATLGNFNTFLGYEVISPAGNFNYSTSYMFSYGPFSHTGVKFDFDLGGGFKLMTGVFNPTDATEFNPTNDYAGGVQLAYSDDAVGIYLNTLISEDFYQFDITAGVNVTDDFYLGLNATQAKDSFYGVAAYMQYSTSEVFSIGARVEYFKDEGVDAVKVGPDNDVIDLTLSGKYALGPLTLIPEVRVDLFSEDVVIDGDELTGTLPSFLLAAVYGF